MIKLNKHSLTAIGRFEPETESLTLGEKDSRVVFTLALSGGETGSEPPELSLGDWLQEEDEPGAGIVWRIRSIEDDYTRKTRTVTAEHVIQSLRDAAIFGEVGPADMGGSDTSCTAEQAIRYALARQSDWQMPAGGLGYSQSAGYSFNGDSVLEAIETVCTTLEDCWWTCDTSAYPFRLYIRPKETESACEMRMARNIVSIRKNIDASQLYTRIYPIGKENIHITGDCLSRNTDIYGIISKVETNQSLGSEGELRDWAARRLKKHSVPSVTITISGLELSQDTGETLDRLRPGRVCRVPLREYGGAMIMETITKVQWKDKQADRESCTVTLANEALDLATIIKEQNENNIGGGGRGGRGGAKAAGEDHAWFVDTEDHVAMVAEAVAGEGASQDWSRVAEVLVDGNGVHQRVTEAEGELVTHESRIDATELAITQEVTDRTAAAQNLQSQITQTASMASMSVGFEKPSSTVTRATRADFPATGAAKTLYIAQDTGIRYLWIPPRGYVPCEVDSGGQANYIKAGEIAIAFNETTGNTEAKLNADVVYAGKGATTLKDLELPDWMDATEGLIAEKATIVSLQAAEARIGTLETDSLKTENLASEIANLDDVTIDLLRVGTLYYGTAAVPIANISDAVYDVQVVANGTNGYKLQKQTIGGGAWTDAGTFSRAVTSWETGWSGGTYSVTAKPQEQSPQDTHITSVLADGAVTYDNKILTVPIKVMANIGQGSATETGYTQDFKVAAGLAYDAGNAHRGSDVGSVATTSDTAVQQLSEYNTKYKIQTRYQKADGTWANGSSYVVLTPPDRYQTGYDDGKPTGATLGSKTATTGIYYNVLVNKGDGGQQAFEVDLSAAYNAARSGYTLGTFTPASVTLQGDAYGDITPIGDPVTPSTYNVTLQGIAVAVDERYSTAYKTSKLGYYPRGGKYSGTLYTDGKTKYTGTLYVGGSYTEVLVVAGQPGEGVNLYKNKGTNYYRLDGTPATYFDVGSNAVLYKKGTVISGLRKAGTVDTTSYYTKS